MTPEAEVDLTIELVCELLASQRPNLADLAVTEVSSGFDNVMYRVGTDLLMRLPRREFSADLILVEHQWLPQLAPGLPLPVPAPTFLGTPTADYPWHWTLLPWLPGAALETDRLPLSEAKVFAAFVTALHQPAPADAPTSLLRGVPLALRAADIEAKMRKLGDLGLVNESHWQLWREALAAPVPKQKRWVHGDLHPRNLLVEGARLSSVIDWSDMNSGDVASDLAAPWMIFDSGATRQAFWSAYLASSSEPHQPLYARARGWALFYGVSLMEHGLDDDPGFAAIAQHTLHAILDSD